MHLRRAHGAVRWIVIVAVVLGLGSAGFAMYWFSRPMVTVTRVVEGPVVKSFYATGTVQPVTEYPIKAGNAGVIVKLLIDKGSAVKKNQELAVVDDPQLGFKRDKAAADIEHARRRAADPGSPVLQEYDVKLKAMETMFKHAKEEDDRLHSTDLKGASQSEKDKAADRVKDLWSQEETLKAQRAAIKLQLETDLKIAEAASVAAEKDFTRQTLRSPIDGVVLDRPTPLGTRLNVNDHIMQIADVRPEKLRMRASVDEENKADLRDGQTVRMSLYAFPDTVFEGNVSKIYEKADSDRRTFEVDVTFTNPDPKLAAGINGELVFIVKEKKLALIAPAQANQKEQLFTLRDGKLTRVENAKIGIKSVERVEVESGLNAGDLIVVSSVADIAPGTQVRIKTIDPVAAAGLNRPGADVSRNPLGGH